ncbi:MAG: hypothetical protein ABIP89_15640, partial [Polyangiaceae bacterium]
MRTARSGGHVGAVLLALLTFVAACSDGSYASGGPPCVGEGQGGSCSVAEDCKPVGTCKCIDGTDTAIARACISGVCDGQT